MSDCDNEDFSSLSAYIGIENETEDGCPSVSIEFDISIKVFLLAYVISKLNTDNDKEE